MSSVVDAIVNSARELQAPLEAELWASDLLGMFGTQPAEDAGLAMGGPVLAALGRRSGRGAAIALRAIGAVHDGELGLRAGRRAEKLSAELPAWAHGIGEAEIIDAALLHDEVYDDASTVLLEARHPGGEVHAVGVLIDHNLGGMAVDIMVIDGLAGLEHDLPDQGGARGGLRFEHIAPADAAERIHTAIDLTDMTVDPPVSEDYSEFRLMGLLRADETPGRPSLRERPELSSEEREQLREEFLSGPEGYGFAPDGEEAFVAALAIDFCANYVDGRPLRWSPRLVEDFMLGFYPRKVLTDESTTAALPAALDAWVRFAGRKRGIPAWAIEETRAAIEESREEMARVAGDPDAGGPARQLLLAAQAAGVNLTEPGELDGFISAWNAGRV